MVPAPRSPLPPPAGPLVVLAAADTGADDTGADDAADDAAGGADRDAAVVDTGSADRVLTATLVARARIAGATAIRTRHPQAARRSVEVIDAIIAARPAGTEPESRDAC